MSRARKPIAPAQWKIRQPEQTAPNPSTPFPSRADLLQELEPAADTAALAGPRPTYFDDSPIIPVVTGVEADLLGSASSITTEQVPFGYRGLIYVIAPYLEDGTGPVTSLRIPGVGVSFTWKLFAGGRPLQPYANITTLLQFAGTTDEPLVEIPEGQRLRVTVTPTDPLGLYSYVGIRIQGRIVRMSTRKARR